MTTPTKLGCVCATLALVVACSSETPTAIEAAPEPAFHKFSSSTWSDPENLGVPVNSACTEQAATLSRKGLTLYFASNRPGGLGVIIMLPGGVPDPNGCQTTNDIWLSRRDCLDCPWGAPENLGPVVNSVFGDGGPSLSTDEDLLFLNSNRPTPSGQGGLSDIYVSRMIGSGNDRGWGPPELLGPDVNTAGFEGGGDYVQRGEGRAARLYFSRGPSGVLQDIYSAPITREGRPLGPAVLIAELSDPATHEATPTVRADGRELFFWGRGGADLWTSTRRTVRDAWSPPEILEPPMNSASLERQPSLSHDGRTLVFSSTRPGSLGEDIWIATRTVRDARSAWTR